MAILTVGQGKQFPTLAAAVAAARDGDAVLVDAGTYVNDFTNIDTRITLKAEGGTVKMVATEAPPNGKAIMVANTDITVDGFEFSGAAVPDGNGAGIRHQGGHLTILNSRFHDNQNGLLANPEPSGRITIRDSEFIGNGAGDGYTHNLYVGEIESLTISGSRFEGAVVGHQIKSRALSTTILDSRIADGEAGTGSYSIDLPNGGLAVIRGNLIEQGAQTGNPVIIAYGVEGNLHGASALEISGNTIVNNLDSPGARLLWNPTGVTAELAGNSVTGLSAAQYAEGPAFIAGPATPDAPLEETPAPSPPPAAPFTPGEGVSLSIQLGAENWEGDPFAIVTVNGEVAFSGLVAAPHDAGGQVIELGFVAAGAGHSISVAFTNDAWGGTPETDRNLHVQDIFLGGVATGQARVLERAGSEEFTLAAWDMDAEESDAVSLDEFSFDEPSFDETHGLAEHGGFQGVPSDELFFA